MGVGWEWEWGRSGSGLEAGVGVGWKQEWGGSGTLGTQRDAVRLSKHPLPQPRPSDGFSAPSCKATPLSKAIKP